MNSAAEIWERVLSILKQNMTETTISTWFSDIEPVALDENRFILSVPTEFKRDILISRYAEDIKRALYDLFSADLDVVILGEEGKPSSKPEAPSRFLPGTEEYTFERFVVGNSNKLAHAAALAVAEHPAENYNPSSSTGNPVWAKTHLLYAIAHTIHKNHPTIRSSTSAGRTSPTNSSETSAPARTRSSGTSTAPPTSSSWTMCSSSPGKTPPRRSSSTPSIPSTKTKKQIVFTADRPPKEMLRLEDRLKTRFEWGLLADIQPPDYETRMAIIKNKAIRMGVELPEEVLIYVAENITSNVRQIEGTVKKILAYRDLLGNNVDASSVTRAVRDMFKETSDILPTAEVIIEEVGKFYDIDPAAIRGQGRTKATSWARHIAIYLTRHMTKLSLKDIGKEFDNRDHTTILHSIDRVEKQCKSDPETNEVIKDIRSNINERYN